MLEGRVKSIKKCPSGVAGHTTRIPPPATEFLLVNFKGCLFSDRTGVTSAAASMTLKQAMGDVSATSNSEKGGPGSLITTSSVSTTNGKIRSKGKMGGGGVKINENSRHHYLIDEDGEDEGTGAGQTGFTEK